MPARTCRSRDRELAITQPAKSRAGIDAISGTTRPALARRTTSSGMASPGPVKTATCIQNGYFAGLALNVNHVV